MNSNLPTALDNLQLMENISNEQYTNEDIKLLTSSSTKDQLKVFLIAQARNELSRVVKLTQFLDILETNFISKVNDEIASNSLTLQQYGNTIEIITSLLARSNDIISRVLNDDTLTTILNTTVYSSGGSTNMTTTVVSQLKDAQSRERVRSVLQQIINKTDDYIVQITNPEEVSND